jgi:hypothetical protein
MALFRQQHINIIRDALPVCVKRQGLEIKEFPAERLSSDAWTVKGIPLVRLLLIH